MMNKRKPPFIVDYTVDGRQFSVLLAGPADWAGAEAHLAAIGASGTVTGSDAVEVPARAIDLWTALAEALLAACDAANRPQEMALAGAAVMVAGSITCGFDRCQAATCAAAVIDEAYRVTP
jgi:hypothetical protein